ncbi:MAG: adenylyl-sulfate kinase [Proteobacteria bacterium]|nr:adenylyl-sulfate kinase [Pseudomonadota bacterium]
MTISESVGRPVLRVVFLGQGGCGGPSLVGRLLHDCGLAPAGNVDAARGTVGQGAAGVAARRVVRGHARDYAVFDAPDHAEFLKDMLTGAAGADAAVLVVDAGEGLGEQNHRHGHLLRFLGIDRIVVAISRMDVVEYAAARFATVSADIHAFLAAIGGKAVHIVPVSAAEGCNLAARGAGMNWYHGKTLIEALETLTAPPPRDELALRMSVEEILASDGRGTIVGHIESGELQVGDRVLVSPSNQMANVLALQYRPESLARPVAGVGEYVAVTLDQALAVERGEIVSHVQNPPFSTDVFHARLFWHGREALTAGTTLQLKMHGFAGQARVAAVEKVLNVNDLSEMPLHAIAANGVGDVRLHLEVTAALDDYCANPRTGRFVIFAAGQMVGGGRVSTLGIADQRPALLQAARNVTSVAHAVSRDMRARMNGHRGGIIWLTGLSGSGKSTLAMAVERALFAKGFQVYVLDGDNVRQGLNSDLGFSARERSENIRRVGEVAHLFADAGLLVVTAFISPFRADRDCVRARGADFFHEIHLAADLATCERRDPRGLYKKARRQEISDMTGITSPYEPPSQAELVLNTGVETVQESVARLVSYIATKFK